MEYRRCVWSTRHIAPPNEVEQTEIKTDYKKINSKWQSSSVGYMKNKQTEVSQDS